MNAKKILAMCLAAVMLVAASVAGTLAYLTAQTTEVKNTFTTTDIGLKLDETKLADDHKSLVTDKTRVTSNEDYEMVPGRELPKDPRVTVLANSEECYVFVEVVKNEYVDTYLDYAINEGWVQVATHDGNPVYALADDATVARATEDTMVNVEILDGDKVTVKSGVTKEQMAALTTVDEDGKTVVNKPELKFFGYAVQAEGFDTAADAWTETFGKTQDTKEDQTPSNPTETPEQGTEGNGGEEENNENA